ncbi:bacillithiol biosynthesis cysteine-adding enzyme BshC [Dyadobacter jejuensis]|uniref:Putative cysteine ligase BshC n=1 Tax=Dyadobacter jejuensis TaxID=1082580 RepID=A0A316AT11_9BACT|nr:bacillithiol biosynthesis cysteine-adding enzyme BshC [Dyadobacter jejuensis]PWJ59950.1 bacillithiol biosynthesis cysteine-adding enzyme BshC [Dyadobacter jejuensis]
MDSFTAVETKTSMNALPIDLRSTGQFPSLLLDYLDQKPEVAKFYETFPTLEKAQDTIEKKKSFDPETRKVLVKALEKQYQNLPNKPDFSPLLAPNTYTVTTGHQLNIFTGPLYIIYKLVTTINLARELKKTYPDCHFVPVYWMATEDHDFDEIASFHLDGQTHRWQGDYTGAVGRLNPNDLAAILKQLPEELLLFKKAYLEHSTLADAVRCYMHELFGQEGLVCLDADDPDLKRCFLPTIQEELLQSPSAELVSQTSAELTGLGYKTPVYAREINFFYLDNNIRERIVKEGDQYQVLNTDLRFQEAEILELTQQHPERFSPNVVMRPLYQEVILPNLAYIGGPSEIPYWMQLKSIFTHYKVPFPMLIPRNFALCLTGGQVDKANKLEIALEDLFLDETSLRKKFTKQISNNKLDLQNQRLAMQGLFDSIAEQAAAIDPTLEPTVKAALTRLEKILLQLEKRLTKAEERNHSSEIGQLMGLKKKLFPNGVAQERYDNLLKFYLTDPQFIQKLLGTFDPLDFRYLILTEK